MSQKTMNRIGTFIIALMICLMVIYLHLMSHRNTQKIYVEQTEKTIMRMKKDFLRDSVNNLIIEINRIKEVKTNNHLKYIESRQRRLEDELDLDEEEFVNFFISKFEEDMSPAMWTAFLWNKDQEILYRSQDLEENMIGATIVQMEDSLIHYSHIEKGDIRGSFGISKAYIDEIVKKEAALLIKSRKFSNDSYIWVNEILDYRGGEDYAIRLVHPMEESEGIYLSTDMEDGMGNKPYMTELEGVLKFGELFHNYYYPKLNSSIVSEKIAYAKLYKDFDWIVSMGVHLDEMNAYIETTTQSILDLSSLAIIKLLRYIFAVLLVGFIILYILEKRNLSNSTRLLESEINYDSLTGAISRRGGERMLNDAFKQYLLTDQSPALMMMDINKFKSINDKYGHDLGDRVLMGVIKTIYDSIRSTDAIIRWGGDEFVAILPGLKKEDLDKFSSKLFSQISELKLFVEDERVKISVSLGFAYFNKGDKDYNGALKRADLAMYKSKSQGENLFTCLE